MIEWDVTMIYSESRNKWMFRLNRDHNTGSLVLPAGFEMDFTTSPRILWGIVPQISRANRASANHDYRYINTVGTRKQADDIFLREMLEDGVPAWKAKLMYVYVRALAWYNWNKYKRRNIDNKHFIV